MLAEIGADEVPQLVVMNKVDLLSPQQVEALGNTPQVSAVTGQGVAELMDRIGAALVLLRRTGCCLRLKMAKIERGCISLERFLTKQC